MKTFLYRGDPGNAASFALLLIRLIAGLAFMRHGFTKIQDPFGWMGQASKMPHVLQALAAVSEFGGGLGWILGLLVPVASLGILSTMSVAVRTHLGRGQPFVGKGGSYELALVFASIAILFLSMGPGRYSLDAALFGRKKKKR